MDIENYWRAIDLEGWAMGFGDGNVEQRNNETIENVKTPSNRLRISNI